VEEALVQSAANHNALLGSHQELKNIIEMLQKGEPVVDAIVEAAEVIADAVA
jgi:hypothetical protein